MKKLVYSLFAFTLFACTELDNPAGADLTVSLTGKYQVDSIRLDGKAINVPSLGYLGSVTLEKFSNQQLQGQATVTINGFQRQARVEPLNLVRSTEVNGPALYRLMRNQLQHGLISAGRFELKETYLGSPVVIYASRQ